MNILNSFSSRLTPAGTVVVTATIQSVLCLVSFYSDSNSQIGWFAIAELMLIASFLLLAFTPMWRKFGIYGVIASFIQGTIGMLLWLNAISWLSLELLKIDANGPLSVFAALLIVYFSFEGRIKLFKE